MPTMRLEGAAARNGSRQRAGPRTDVENCVAVANHGESNQKGSDFAAPPAHEPLVPVPG